MVKASSMEDVWVAITTRWRFIRSATAPPNGASRKTGIWLEKPTMPSNVEEPVSR